jgi:dTDP-4-amino-4,6-dideoxy-D-galactose acyltransferase
VNDVNDNTEILPWDSQQLGFLVARIKLVSSASLKPCLEHLQAQGVKLVYGSCDSNDLSVQHAIGDHHYFLDERIIYERTLGTQSYPVLESIQEQTEYTKQLETLALTIGAQSRFGRDPAITLEQMHNIYRAWLINCLKRIRASVVLSLKEGSHICGFIAITHQNNYGIISLIAVGSKDQGKGFGKQLIQAAEQWCIQHGYDRMRVTTQKTNRAACHLYEHCGYRSVKIENFYHFWL